MFNITTLRVRLFTWLLLRLKQPQQSTCLVNIKTQFIFYGHWVLNLKRSKNEAALGCFSSLHCSLKWTVRFFYIKKTVQWIDFTRTVHVNVNNNFFLKKTSLEWIKFTRTVISILFLIIFYLILLHAQKIMETVVLVGWILYVMKL